MPSKARPATADVAHSTTANKSAKRPGVVTDKMLCNLLFDAGIELKASARAIARVVRHFDESEHVRPHIARIIELGEILCEMVETPAEHALTIKDALARVRMVEVDHGE